MLVIFMHRLQSTMQTGLDIIILQMGKLGHRDTNDLNKITQQVSGRDERINHRRNPGSLEVSDKTPL